MDLRKDSSMAIPETVVLLGPAIAKGMLKIWLRNSPAQELVPDLVELLLRKLGGTSVMHSSKQRGLQRLGNA